METNFDIKFDSIDGVNIEDSSNTILSVGKLEGTGNYGRNQQVSDASPEVLQGEKAKKSLLNSKQKSLTGNSDVSKKDQIEEFLAKYTGQLNDVSVKDMRHMIPLFLMEVYSDIYGHYTRKVKGLWDKSPKDWPESVPFVDPNNKLKSDGEFEVNRKPKKEMLGKMLSHLVILYKEKKNKAAETSSLSSDVMYLHMTTDSTAYQDDGDGMIQLRDDLDTVDPNLIFGPCDLFTEHFLLASGDKIPVSGEMEHSGLLSSGVSSVAILEGPEKPPKQVMDNEESEFHREDWNPVEELNQRLPNKLGFLIKQKFLPENDLAFLKETYDLILDGRDETSDDDHAVQSLLKRLHRMEEALDSVLMYKKLSPTYSLKLSSIHDKLTMKKAQTQKLNFQSLPADGVGIYGNTRVDMSHSDMTSLNIEPRPGPDNRTANIPSVTHLKLRSVTGQQKEKNVTEERQRSTLSDNLKPIQRAEEEFQITLPPGMPEFSGDEIIEALRLQLGTDFSVPVQETTNQPSSVLAEGWTTQLLTDLMTSNYIPAMEAANTEGLPLMLKEYSTEAVAEKCINRLSLNQNAETSSLGTVNSLQPNLNQLWIPTAVGKSGSSGKRSWPFVDDDDDDIDNTEKPMAKNPALQPASLPDACNPMIPTTVFEMGDADMPYSRSTKKKYRTTARNCETT